MYFWYKYKCKENFRIYHDKMRVENLFTTCNIYNIYKTVKLFSNIYCVTCFLNKIAYYILYNILFLYRHEHDKILYIIIYTYTLSCLSMGVYIL